MGLRRRFAVTRPAAAVLIACMLILGVAASGLYTVINVPENHYLAKQQAPTVSVVNLTVNTLDGKINLHFTNNDSQICQISFVKQYGPIAEDNGWEYRSQSTYQYEPASIFNYTTENEQANVTAISSRIMIDITLNPNLKYNLNFYSVFGDITINVPPGSQSIQTSNLGSKYGSVSYK